MSSNTVITNNEDTKIEPILDESNDRLTIYPIKHHNIWHHYKLAIASMWQVEEVDLTEDKNDWKQLSDNERTFIKHVLSFFATADTLVNLNLVERFLNEVKIPEAKFFYSFQLMIENVHSEAYSLMIDTYIESEEEKQFLFNGIENIPSIKKKGAWARRWIESKEASFAQRLLGIVLIEAVMFCGSFAAIYWMKDRGRMVGLSKFNHYIARDESSHSDFACELYNMLKYTRLEEKAVHEIFTEAVDIEKEFISDSIKCPLVGINSDLMSKYIEFVADRLLVQLNYNKLYHVKSNPLVFMEKISLANKSNFFERRPTEYQLLANNKTYKDMSSFVVTDDF